MVAGAVASWVIGRFDRWLAPKLERRANERREREMRQDEIDYRGWKLSTVGNEEARELQAGWERDDKMAALFKEKHADDAAIERAAKERGCPDAATLLARIAKRKREIDHEIERELQREH